LERRLTTYWGKLNARQTIFIDALVVFHSRCPCSIYSFAL
jgi:hypothetical protein